MGIPVEETRGETAPMTVTARAAPAPQPATLTLRASVVTYD